jgi:hypothetical protein
MGSSSCHGVGFTHGVGLTHGVAILEDRGKQHALESGFSPVLPNRAGSDLTAAVGNHFLALFCGFPEVAGVLVARMMMSIVPSHGLCNLLGLGLYGVLGLHGVCSGWPPIRRSGEGMVALTGIETVSRRPKYSDLALSS